MTSFNNSINSAYGYNLGGITNIWLLDIDGFVCCTFKEDKLSNICVAENILATSDFIKLEAINESSFTEAYTDKAYLQKLTTFIYPLTGDNLAKMLELRSKRYFVVFQNKHNQFFGFGSDGGASIIFSQQTGKTNDIQGYSISIEKSSTVSLFEIQDIVLGKKIYKYTPSFDDGVYCQLVNGKQNGSQIASYVLKTTLEDEKVDINGNLCQLSKLPQAIMVLDGFRTPDGNYQVEGYYNENTTHIQGYSITQSNKLCEPQSEDYIKIVPEQISFDGNQYTKSVDVYSSCDWSVNKLTTNKDIASHNIASKNKGKSTVVFKAGADEGAGYFEFKAGSRKATLTVFNRNPKVKIWLSKSQITFFDPLEEEKEIKTEDVIVTYINSSKHDRLVITPLSKQIASYKSTQTQYDDNKVTISFSITKGSEKGCEYLKFSIGGETVLLNIMNLSTSPEWVLKLSDKDSVWNNSGVWMTNKVWK